jgi:hypothetical protein
MEEEVKNQVGNILPINHFTNLNMSHFFLRREKNLWIF